MRSFLRALTVAAVTLASGAGLAESKSAPPKPAQQAPQAKQELKMETVQLVGLIKSTIMALQHANQTGNYSVAPAVSAPQSVSAPPSGIPSVGQPQPTKPTASNGSEKKHQKTASQ